ncbi:LPS biosynthesis protein WbpP [Oceanidesulfovibrio indonesiensis]|uniref:LPS biosynthesis protein WbpP n=1 Tax=Oceanidesulfovibrio indonesiensis TaxID=54767 RepID=A0A7M3MHZ5_9BACT|nr:SDR family oxidoreductase [Oceanidesulfovibrio indonesiensis]TVM19239.1 LPS biosynthesis protein WbpP [Oceanidesulfovibrio indonesiensis]
MPSIVDVERAVQKNPRRWLVTGVAGFIGSNILQRLLELGQVVTGLDNLSAGHLANLDEVRSLVGPEAWSRFTFIKGDIRDPRTCAAVCAGADYVLHQAALGSVPLSIEDPVEAHGSNLTGFLHMLIASREAGARTFVYAASSATYGDGPGLPKTEDMVGEPLSPYAVTKYANELYARVFNTLYGMRTVGLRYFNVFGQRQDPNGAYAAVIPAWFAALINGDSAVVNGDGETTRDFCHVDNVVQANLLAALSLDDAAAGEVYNIACGRSTTLNELYRFIQNEVAALVPAAAQAKLEYRDFRPGDVRHSLASIDKAQQRLGYAVSVDVEEGLKRATPWYVKRLSKVHV